VDADFDAQAVGEARRIGPIYPIEGQSILVAEFLGYFDRYFALAVLVLGPAVRLAIDPAAEIGRTYPDGFSGRF
jgi:hypothetical protein